MFEVIHGALVWAASPGLWCPQGGGAFRPSFLIALGILAAVLAFSLKGLAYRLPAIRRSLMPEERYAGRYLQALWRKGEVRYSIVRIFYNARRGRYEVTGRTYSTAGRKLSDFKSAEVLLPPSSKDGTIEFLWRSGPSSKGYTSMTPEEPGNGYIQGDGRVVTFDTWPMAYPVLFKLLHDHHVRKALGVRSPVRPAEEPEFVQKFHAAFGENVLEGFGGRRAESRPLAERHALLQN